MYHKRILLTCCATMALLVSSAQLKGGGSNNFSLAWGEPKTHVASEFESFSYLSFDGAIYNDKNVPLFSHTIELKSYTEFSVSLTNMVTEPLTQQEIGLVNGAGMSNDFQISEQVGVQRGRNIGIINVLPVRSLGDGTYEKLVSFGLNIEYGYSPVATQRSSRTFVTSSVMASGSGDWYKIGVVSDGIYRVDYSFMSQMVNDMSGVQVDHVHLFGNSMGMQPTLNSAYKPDDLLENAIEMVDANSNSLFDQGDYFLFYAKGADNVLNNGTYFRHENNYYTDTSYYFVNIDANRAPKRVQSKSSDAGAATHFVTKFTDYAYIEKDAENFIKSGREWYGDEFDVLTSRTYNFSFPGITNDQVTVVAEVLANHPTMSSTFTLTEIGSGSFINLTCGSVTTSEYAPAAKLRKDTLRFTPSGSSFTLRLDYNKPDASAKGWLNTFDVNAFRTLSFTGSTMSFRDLASVGVGNIAEYTLQNAGAVQSVWDVTDPSNVESVNYTLSGSDAIFQFNADSVREFVAYDGNNFGTPVFRKQVTNQDLHALSQADYLIVVHPMFLGEANKLADFHRTRGLTVHVVTTDQVYNEFSSGMPDAIGIRNFVRMFYERAGGDPTLMPDYLLLFGDGSYDNKYRINGNENFIVTYQSRESLLATDSFTSDDHFVVLDPSEGEAFGDLVDVGVGRFPVSTLSEAASMVAKTIHYMTNSSSSNGSHCNIEEGPATLGSWRNIVAVVADDEDDARYVDGTEGIVANIEASNPELNIEKIYLDGFVQESTPGGERYYDVADKIDSRIQQGCLVINYMGHGGEGGWAHERILDIPTINAWTNYNSMAIFMTATCEFSRFDDPERTSAGELVFLNSNGGGAALFTTTRLVFAGQNTILNTNFYDHVFDETNGEPHALGYILTLTKNSSIDTFRGNHRKFSILGDPAITLALPKHHVVTDSINGIEISTTDTLGALSTVTVKGHITDNPSGSNLTAFNGYVFPTVFDKTKTLTTLENDPTSQYREFDVRQNVIYKGKASVTNGEFQFSFVVPKDIAYNIGPGRISYYAHDGSEDAHGYTHSFMIGGADTSAVADNEGPEIELYMNNDKFVDGGTTDESPTMLANLFDQNGINTVGNGIGHDIAAVIDENTSGAYILNDYYESDVDTYQSGTVKYQFSELDEGAHTLSLKAWDVHNNSSEAQIEFVVASSADMALEHVLNYPNPFTTHTSFMFEHNQVCQSLDVQVQIYTVSGKLVKTIDQTVLTDGYRVDGIDWDGRDDFGDRIGRGVYMYRLQVQTPDGIKAEKTEKLVILK